jgi:prepilin-type N-terminal cleavage/methylation domain-containing protein
MTCKAFTLIELLVVVLIIGILAAVALPQYRKAVMTARHLTVLPTMRAIIDAEERYYLIHGEFAKRFENLDIDIPGVITHESPSYMDSFTLKDYIFQLRFDRGITRELFFVSCASTKNTDSVAFRYAFYNRQLYCTSETSKIYYPGYPEGEKFCSSRFGPPVTCPSIFGAATCYKAHF